LVGFDNAKEPVWIFLVVGATNTKAKALILNWNNPAPVFREELFGLETLPA
jgi:hypothetical protein